MRYGAEAPSQAHSETSIAAAEAIEPARSTLRDLVLAAIQAAGVDGMTDQEIQTRLRLDPSTERPRRVELVVRGLVGDSGRTRPTSSGRRATVWVAPAPGGVS